MQKVLPMPMKLPRSLVLYLLLFFLIPSTQAHAYLDPGSGSLIIQALIAGLLGLLVALRAFRETILSFLGIKRSPPKDEDDGHNPTDDNLNP
jgi:hypothetical protein